MYVVSRTRGLAAVSNQCARNFATFIFVGSLKVPSSLLDCSRVSLSRTSAWFLP